jgi:nuclear transport factor 2 (NTF2) superfamily protein
METKPPIPPFSYEDAAQKVRMAENAWNTRDPDKVRNSSIFSCSSQAVAVVAFVHACMLL